MARRHGLHMLQAMRHMGSWAAAGTSKPGLFGVLGLNRPQDFISMSAETRARCDELLQQVLTAPADASVIKLMDEMSDQLCRTYDAAECCRNIHSDPTWRQAATQACVELGGYISEVNHHAGMYNALASAMANYQTTAEAAAAAQRRAGGAAGGVPPPPAPKGPAAGRILTAAQLSAFCPETALVGSKLQLDMEKAGIHLPDAPRQRMQDLMNASNHFAAMFNRSLTDPKQLGRINVGNGGLLAGDRTVPLDASSVSQLLCTEKSEEVRQRVYMASGLTPASNVQLLEQMIAVRREMAQLVGCASYSGYKAWGASLSQEPAAITAFLEQLAGAVRERADAEVMELRRMKAAEFGGSWLPPLNAWDLERYLGMAKRRVEAKLQGGWLQDYTRLPVVLSGFAELLQRLMGIQLDVRAAPPGESWAPGVIKATAHHPDMGLLGTVYLDLCSRPGKYPNAVTFPIRCGRELAGGEYQAPIMALLADFGAPSTGMARFTSSSTAARGSAVAGDLAGAEGLRMSQRELRVLLHELGHCVHNLVSRTKYQHLWGTRCAQDVVEVPSHLFEHFVTDNRTLRLIARHHSSGEPLPAAACEALAAERRAFAALELQQQLLLSLVDQAYFGPDYVAPGTTADVWQRVYDAHSSVPYVPGTHPEARVGHFTIYGAGYYSYVYARCLSSAVWEKHLAHDPLDPGAGAAILQLLLRPGGSREPIDLMSDVLGGRNGLQQLHGGWAPTHDQYLREALHTFN